MQQYSPLQYLQMDIAARFGLDKSNWIDRLLWFSIHEDELEDLVSSAKEPALYMAAVMSFRQVMEGIPSGYPISFDCTASGMQLLSILIGDVKAASICNVTGDDLTNAYTEVFERMIEVSGENISISEDDCKRAIMTSLYGSKAEPKKLFEPHGMLHTFYEAMEYMAPGCWELNNMLLDMWDDTATEYRWVMPDNFHVIDKVIGTVEDTVIIEGETVYVYYKQNMAKEKGRSLGANITHSVESFIVREIVRRASYNVSNVNNAVDLINGVSSTRPNDIKDSQMVAELWELYTETGFLSARILDYLNNETILMVDQADISKLIHSMPDKPFPVLTTHDCFRVVPNNAHDLRLLFRELYALLAESHLLQWIISCIAGQRIQIHKLSDQLPNLIRKSEYAIS